MKNTSIVNGIVGENSLAHRYDKLHQISTEASDRAKQFPPLSGAKRIIADYLKDKRGKLLDLGCGRGELLIQAPSHFDEKVGLDFSLSFLHDAVIFTNQYASDQESRIKWILHDLNENWPLDNSYFDVVISTACIEHTFDVYHLFRECNRVLKGGGYFYFTVPNIAYIKHRIRLLFGYIPVTASSIDLWWRDYWDGTHMHYFTADSLRMLCSQNGFQVLNITGSGKYRHFRAWWPTLLCGDLIMAARKI